MRSPPPIPRLRRDLRLVRGADGATIDDPALHRVTRFEGAPWSELLAQLRATPPAQAELSRALQIPRLRVQTMVRTLIAVHAFAIPRALEQSEIHRFSRAFRMRGRRPIEWLTPCECLGPSDRSRLRRRVAHTLRQLVLSAFPALEAIVAVERVLVARHKRLEIHEIFATREAFHIVRPDPEEAPERLHRLIDTCGEAAQALPPTWRDALHQVLGGVDPTPGPRLPRAIIEQNRGLTGFFKGFDRVLATAVSFLMQRILTVSPSLSLSEPAFRSWSLRHRDLIRELFFVQARVFVAAGPPAPLPAWWSGPGFTTA